MKKSNSNDNPWRAAGAASAIGANLAVCILLGYFGGVLLSNRTNGHEGWVVAGIIAGLFVGTAGTVFLIKFLLGDANE